MLFFKALFENPLIDDNSCDLSGFELFGVTVELVGGGGGGGAGGPFDIGDGGGGGGGGGMPLVLTPAAPPRGDASGEVNGVTGGELVPPPFVSLLLL